MHTSRGLTLGIWWLLATLLVSGCRRESSVATADPSASTPSTATTPAEFLRLMNVGKNAFDQGDATNAASAFGRAVELVPHDADARLNLANARLLAGDLAATLRETDEVLRLAPHSAAAYFVRGCAQLRLGKPADAVQSFENVRQLDQGDTATWFQLGRARLELQQWDAAITAFKEGLALDPHHLHAAAHYLLGQALLKAGRLDEARRELEQHQVSREAGDGPASFATFEKSPYTQARIPFALEQPDPTGVPVRFTDATAEVLGPDARQFSGPVGVLHVGRAGANSLFVFEPGRGFRVLLNSNGVFQPQRELYPVRPNATYRAMVVGDLQNDRVEDVIVVGPQGSQVFRFDTNGLASDVTDASHLRDVPAVDAQLMDLDFTGKLDLLVASERAPGLRVFRQSTPLEFVEITAASGAPPTLAGARGVTLEDWNGDQNSDVLVDRDSGPPLLLQKQRRGPLVSASPTNWVAGALSCTGDFDNDLRPDLAVVGDDRITISFNSGARTVLPRPAGESIRQLCAIDYDNDGWLDLWAAGDTLRAWRNRGLAGFEEHSHTLGLDTFAAGPVASIRVADFDGDCDPDVLVALRAGGLRYLRNDGANANAQVKVQLSGNRSNASGIGCKVEIVSGGLRLRRMVQRLPIEIGVGKAAVLDSFLVHWFNWPQGAAEVPVQCSEPILAAEATIQEGSCPYLYAWDGTRFRFVTDILGAAPLGLPVSEDRLVEADPEEWVWVGTADTFRPRGEQFVVQITEELREVLYLDEARLAVVDHPADVEVHPTDKLLPHGPFPPGTLAALRHEHPLRRAERSDGRDVTEELRTVDGRRASPVTLRIPQLRGLAEPHGYTLDFGPLEVSRPLVLVLNGWLRFGGGMANIAAARDPSLPFPFPTLEAETAPDRWIPVDVTVGAPAGKTKTILVDLTGKLPSGTRRLRLQQAFEIHWDRIALLERESDSSLAATTLPPTRADLQFRGFSALENQPPDAPPTPNYDAVSPRSRWTLIPGGWCTRYGDVRELVGTRDEGLALIHSGDALTLEFAASGLPTLPSGHVREFFLYVDGWDKDSDFHVREGQTIEPLPFHGLRDQQYGQEVRPAFPSDELHQRYNTRWIEGKVLARPADARAPMHP